MAAIGIDIGGTQLRAALYDQDFRALDRFSAPNQKEIGPRANLDKLAAMCGYRERGHVIDKLVREKMLQLNGGKRHEQNEN